MLSDYIDFIATILGFKSSFHLFTSSKKCYHWLRLSEFQKIKNRSVGKFTLIPVAKSEIFASNIFL